MTQAKFPTEMTQKTSDFFIEIHGNQLSSVEFVQDYLQLRFDGPCINVYNPITVTTSDDSKTSWEKGFRDLLCEQIAKKVDTILLEDSIQLSIHFEDGSKIIVSLRDEDYSTPEAIYAHGFQNNNWTTL